ncbi:PREDICTED: disrupted in renal carcinoma protein 2 homolog, partial [Nestor notabilis]|uniref:disrupted in renal carcinoma protein 2 homolog n=1 Tax=Nestor notabilis TaxID=176057 RepID=UPI00052334C9
MCAAGAQSQGSLRVTVLLTSSLMVLGAGLRCVPVSDLEIRKKLIHGGQLLNGLAGPTVMNAAPFLSTTWFSPDERATATAIASLLNYLGAAGAFLVGPLVVPSPNGTSHLPLVSQSNAEHIKDRIEAVLYAEFGMVSLIFSAALAYFPSRPPFPPSVAAASQRLSYRRSFCRLLRLAVGRRCEYSWLKSKQKLTLKVKYKISVDSTPFGSFITIRFHVQSVVNSGPEIL